MYPICSGLTQRTLFSVSFAGITVAALPRSGAEAPSTASPDAALEKLKNGNQRYLNAPQLCEADLASQRASVAKAQAPWATILACSDSRVSPELIFGGVGLGELFVAVTPETWPTPQQWAPSNMAPSTCTHR